MHKIPVVLTTFFLATLPLLLLRAQDAAPPAVDPVAKPAAGSSFMMQLPMIVMFMALFYFLMIAPQRKQAKKAQDFQKALSKGDEVITNSGIIGTIAGLNERVVTLEVAPGTEIKMLRSQVNGKLKELNTLEGKA